MDLKSLRISKKLTQQQIAFLAGITLNTYICIEKGSGNPTLETIVKLAKTLNLKPSELIDILVNVTS